jgi:alkanesulfonate monooxygenase SsuD/methylene tetrahydromethanopterin reductase-like flavin-dependent oxidoreductase (luciferase family)
MEQTAFGVDRERSRDDWREAIEIVCGMWRDEYFEYESERFRFPRRMVTPKPVQDPHPPCWMAATSDGSADVAGRNGLGLLSFSIMQPLARMAAHIAAYRSASEGAHPLTGVTTNKVAAYTLVHITGEHNDDDVWSSVGWWYSNLAQFTLQWELPHLTQEEKETAFPFLSPLMNGEVPIERFDNADMIVVGDTERCIKKMKHYADLGVDELICYVQFGYLSHHSILRTIEVLGKEVVPELAAYVPG